MIPKYIPFGRMQDEMSRLPTGYRIAFYDLYSLRAVAYPIGLHLVAKFVRRIWEWSLRYRFSKMELFVDERVHEAVIEERSFWEGKVEEAVNLRFTQAIAKNQARRRNEPCHD